MLEFSVFFFSEIRVRSPLDPLYGALTQRHILRRSSGSGLIDFWLLSRARAASWKPQHFSASFAQRRPIPPLLAQDRRAEYFACVDTSDYVGIEE